MASAARIGSIDGEQPIAWTRIAPNAEAALRKMREGSRHAAIVGGDGGRQSRAVSGERRLVQRAVRSAGAAGVERAARRRRARRGRRDAEVRLVAHATRQPRAGLQHRRRDSRASIRSLPPVCVMTPRSGWHANASERGGGLVCWLETMRAVTHPAAAGRRDARPAANRAVHRVERPRARPSRPARLPASPSGARRATPSRGCISAPTSAPRPARSAMTPSDDRLRDAALRALAPHGLDDDPPVAGGAGRRRGGDDQGRRRPLRLVHRRECLVPQPARSLARRGGLAAVARYRARGRRSHAVSLATISCFVRLSMKRLLMSAAVALSSAALMTSLAAQTKKPAAAKTARPPRAPRAASPSSRRRSPRCRRR